MGIDGLGPNMIEILLKKVGHHRLYLFTLQSRRRATPPPSGSTATRFLRFTLSNSLPLSIHHAKSKMSIRLV
jgi:hypothetical protein